MCENPLRHRVTPAISCIGSAIFSCLCRKVIHQLRYSSRSLNNKGVVFVEVARILVLALLVSKLASSFRKAQHLKS